MSIARDPFPRGLDRLAHSQALAAIAGRPRGWATRVAGLHKGVSNSQPGVPAPIPADTAAEEQRTFVNRIFIRDTNFDAEELGHLELSMTVVRLANGQIAVTAAKVTKNFESRAQRYLKVNANINSASMNVRGKRFSDVVFDIEVGGPEVTEGSSWKVSAKTEDGTTGEIGGSTSMTTRSAAMIQRHYRIEGLEKEVANHVWDGKTGTMVQSKTGMMRDEVTAERKDLAGLELDDDEVGDKWDTFYANWILHSYEM